MKERVKKKPVSFSGHGLLRFFTYALASDPLRKGGNRHHHNGVHLSVHVIQFAV